MGKLSKEEIETREQAVVNAGLDATDARDWYKRFNTHVNNADKRGLQSHLTFDAYMRKVQEAGITDPNQLGSYSGQFHLGRIGDVGDYSTNNCRFITSNQNHQEAVANGCMNSFYDSLRGSTKDTSERAKKISEAHTGRTKETHQYLAERSESQRGRSKETHAYLAEKGPKISESKAKTFVLTAPDGTVHEGKHLSKFCEANGLSVSGLAGVCKGRLRQHKGWTGVYVDKPD